MIYTSSITSPLGRITVAGNRSHLLGLWIEGQKYFAEGVAEEMRDSPDAPVLAKAANWLERYFAGQKPAIDDLPIAPEGGDFRRAVWEILCAIPYGELMTYGEIARIVAGRFGKKPSAQAVGGAVAHNPISIIIPCHRVVGASGSLTGYAGGIGKKVWLLEHEGADLGGLFLPSRGTAL